MTDGFVVVDKPAGITSHDAVARLRRALGTRRVGHAGTLDPMATGVLVVGVGAATRLLRYVESTAKRYVGEVTFGTRTDSLDATGEVTDTAGAGAVDEETVRAILPRFTGELEQIPPMVSAIKIGGEKLHVKARRGETVERPPRKVRIEQLECTRFEPGPPPRAELDVICSAGTYIRTLADDLGVALGTFAHLSALRRTAVGPMTIHDAVPLDEVDPTRVRGVLETLRHLPVRSLTAEDAEHVRHGRRIPALGADGAHLGVHDGALVAVLADDGDVAKISVGLPHPLR